MKAIDILKAVVFTDSNCWKGFVTMPSEITCMEDVVERLEKVLGEEVDVEESMMDDFLPGTEYFYSEVPLTNEDCYQNAQLMGGLPVQNIVCTYAERPIYFYEIDE